jgi:hypothetical protein
MSVRWFVGVVATIAFIAGLVVMTTTVNAANDGGRDIPCGNAFRSDPDEAYHEGRVEDLTDVMLGLPSGNAQAAYGQRCADALANRRLLGWPLTVVGLVGVLGAVLIRTGSTPLSPVRRKTTEPAVGKRGPEAVVPAVPQRSVRTLGIRRPSE